LLLKCRKEPVGVQSKAARQRRFRANNTQWFLGSLALQAFRQVLKAELVFRGPRRFALNGY